MHSPALSSHRALRLRPSPDARTDAAGNRQRSSVLTRDILPFLFMGQATKHEILWMAETVRKLH